MKKSAQLGIMMFVVLLFISGCVSNRQAVDLAICGSFSVPGMFCADLKGGAYECAVMEEDSQGRVLYTYTAQSVITGKKERAAIICQKRDGEAVYYYEDICYLISEWESDDLALLKEKNDWEQPLDYSKMVHKSNKTTLDGYIITVGNLEHTQIKQACCGELGIEQQQILELCFLDADSTKMELYWLVVNGYSGEECYFVLVDNNYHIVCQRVERSMCALAEQVSLKLNNGWGREDGARDSHETELTVPST